MGPGVPFPLPRHWGRRAVSSLLAWGAKLHICGLCLVPAEGAPVLREV